MNISDNPSDEGTGHTFDETVEAFSRLLDPVEATDEDEENSPQGDAEDESEALEVEESEDDAPEDEESDEAEDSDTDHEDEEQDDTSIDLNRKVSIKVDGQTVEVTLAEALSGYQRQSDYSKKTAALAQERNAFQQEVQAVRNERQQYAYVIQQLQQELAQRVQTQQPDWQSLYENDPIEYLRQKDQYRDQQARMQAAQAEQARLEQIRHQEEVQAYNSYVASEREKMLAAVPAWKDPKVWDRDRKALIEYGMSQGFTESELLQASDSRAVVQMFHAMKAHKVATAQAKAKPASAKPVSGPKPMTTQGKAPKRADGLTKAKQRQRASGGDIASTAEVFKHLL